MPYYDFNCPECAHELEDIKLPSGEVWGVVCPKCLGMMRVTPRMQKPPSGLSLWDRTKNTPPVVENRWI